jgi:hypothetical protein
MIRRHLHRSPTNREGFDHPRFYDLRFALRRSKESTGFPLRPIVPSFFRCMSELMARALAKIVCQISPVACIVPAFVFRKT